MRDVTYPPIIATALAGFTKGAVYYYFKDKESLLVEVLKRIERTSMATNPAAASARPRSSRSRRW